MKKKISLLLITLILLISVFSTIIYATEVISDDVATGENPLISTNEREEATEEQTYTYSDFFHIAEDDYKMDEYIDGNVFLMANGDITMKGEVNGTAFVIANGTVTLDDCVITDALFVMAKNVVINGVVYDVYSLSNNFELGSTAWISRDANICGENIKLLGRIERNANVSAKNITVQNEDVQLYIGGNFNYSSSKEIEGLDKIVTRGKINFIKANDGETAVRTTKSIVKEYVLNACTSIVYVLIVYLLIKLVSSKFIERVGKDVKEKSIVAFAVGLLAAIIMVLAIVCSIFILLTWFGVPVAILAWIIMLLVAYISPAVFQISLLEVISNKFTNIKDNIGYKVLTLIGISLCVWILKEIPYIGGIVSIIVSLTGLGLTVRNAITRNNKEVEKVEE